MGFSRQEYWSGFFLQGIFPTQESNAGLLHCQQILYQLSYNLKNDRIISVHFQGKPYITVIQVAPTSNAEEAEVEWF